MFSSSTCNRLAAIAVIFLVPLSVAFVAAPDQDLAAGHGRGGVSRAAPLPHPHFPKTLICEISKGSTITVKYLTVTFDKAGAKKMPVGAAWHLAGGTFETSQDLIVGGQKVKEGKYSLSVRKAKAGWQLTLHKGKGFSLPGADAMVLKTEFKGRSMLFEHLNCDIQPGGDKKHTQLYLDVRFDKMLARTLIEIPE